MSGFLPVEIAVQDGAGVRVALEAGATRVELCQALGLGGLTPSAGSDRVRGRSLRAAASAPSFVHVLVRPRGGGFVYDDDEMELIMRDIRVVRSLGAAGVVVGAMTDAGALDLARSPRSSTPPTGSTSRCTEPWMPHPTRSAAVASHF